MYLIILPTEDLEGNHQIEGVTKYRKLKTTNANMINTSKKQGDMRRGL